ncbi:MAG TPA: hypothetical protein VIX17_20450 [Pyrinomonadaceae bacterium]
MEKDYLVSDVVEVGKAEEVILGGKDVFTTDDGTQGQLAGIFDE